MKLTLYCTSSKWTHRVVIVFVLSCLTIFIYHNIFMLEHENDILPISEAYNILLNVCGSLFILLWDASLFSYCKECCCELGCASSPKSACCLVAVLQCIPRNIPAVLDHTATEALRSTAALLSTGSGLASLCSC